MLTIAAATEAPAEVVWPLLAEPSQWRRWAPHIRGGRGLGAPEVQAGRRGVAFVGVGFGGFGAPVPVHVLAKTPGVSWEWEVGPVRLVHRVEVGDGAGSRVVVEIVAPALVEAAMRVTYGPVISVLLRNLGRVAAGDAAADQPSDGGGEGAGPG